MRNLPKGKLWRLFSTAACCLLCVLAWRWHDASSRQAAAIKTIMARNDESKCFYDYQIDASKSVRKCGKGDSVPPWCFGATCYLPMSPPPGPAWVRRLLGDDFINPIIAVAAFNLDDDSLKCLENFPQLRYLAICNSHITDVGLKHIRGLSELRILDFSPDSERIPTITDVGLANLNRLTHLEVLNLANANLAGSGLVHLQEMKQLKELDLEDTNVDDAGMKHLNTLENITCLCLRNTTITNKGLPHLRSLKRLEYLDISGTKVTDAGLEHLKSLTQLEYLLLQKLDISDAGLEPLKTMRSLRSIHLSKGRLTTAGIDALKKALPDTYLDIGD